MTECVDGGWGGWLGCGEKCQKEEWGRGKGGNRGEGESGWGMDVTEEEREVGGGGGLEQEERYDGGRGGWLGTSYYGVLFT